MLAMTSTYLDGQMGSRFINIDTLIVVLLKKKLPPLWHKEPTLLTHEPQLAVEFVVIMA